MSDESKVVDNIADNTKELDEPTEETSQVVDTESSVMDEDIADESSDAGDESEDSEEVVDAESSIVEEETNDAEESDDAESSDSDEKGTEDSVETGDAESDDADEDETEDSEAEEEVPRPDDTEWYVVHSYSGYENKVEKNLMHRIESMGMQDKIFQVVVPTEEEVELKDGHRRTIERRVFPGYILVEMVLDEDSWYVVRNTPGVTGFVGSGNKPTPLRPDEVDKILKRMEAEAPKVKVSFRVGEKVRIVEGPFEDFMGTVDEIDLDRTRVRVLVNFFGRETPIELDFLQVERA